MNLLATETISGAWYRVLAAGHAMRLPLSRELRALPFLKLKLSGSTLTVWVDLKLCTAVRMTVGLPRRF